MTESQRKATARTLLRTENMSAQDERDSMLEIRRPRSRHFWDILLSASTTCGVGVSIATLAVLYVQTRGVNRGIVDQSRAVDLQTQRATERAILDVDKFFIDRSDLKPLFYSGTDVSSLDDAHRGAADSAVEWIADVFSSIYDQDKDTDPTWTKFMSHIYSCSGVLRGFLADHRDWYDEDFIKDLQGRRGGPSTPCR